MITNFSAALRRAAQRVPGPVAERSLAQAAPFRRTADYHDVPLPEPTVRAGPVRLGPNERWCARCGESVNEHGFCPRCGSKHCRAADTVLRPDEYYVAQ